MMRIHFLSLFISIALISTAVQGEDSPTIPISIFEEVSNGTTTYILQGESTETPDEYFVDQYSDAGLINTAIRDILLPSINWAIETLAPDPLNINRAGVADLGTMNFDLGGILTCSAGLKLDYGFGNIQGLSKIAIDTLRIFPGTEQVSAGCALTEWIGEFELAMSSVAEFAMNDLAAGFQAQACGMEFAQNLQGSISTFQPALRGRANLAGFISPMQAAITSSEILQSLEVDYERIEATLVGVPAEIKDFVTQATAELSIAMKQELINTVEPAARPKIQEAMIQKQSTMFAMPLNARFVRNGAQRQIKNVVNSALNFFGLGN